MVEEEFFCQKGGKGGTPWVEGWFWTQKENVISWAMPAFNVHKVGLANPFRLLKMIEWQVPYEPHQKHRGERKWLNRGFHLQTRRPDLPATTGSPRWLPLSFTSLQLLRNVRDNKHILKDRRPHLFLRDLAFHHINITPPHLFVIMKPLWRAP